jgi:hypothetical protein
MKRHFSNRGEALAEVTAARCLASRNASVKASFMIQNERRTKFSGWLQAPKGAISLPAKKHKESKKENTLIL